MSKNPNAHKGRRTDNKKRNKQIEVRKENMTMEQKIAEREAKSTLSPEPSAPRIEQIAPRVRKERG